MKPKSWKREVAAACLLLWALVTVRLFFFVPAMDLAAYEGIYNGITAFLVPSALAVFIGDAIIKQRPRHHGHPQPPEGAAG